MYMIDKIKVQNLKCGGCETTVRIGLEKVDGVEEVVKIEAETGEIELRLSSDIDIVELKDKLNQMGYPMEDNENTLGMKIKSYASCMVGRISK